MFLVSMFQASMLTGTDFLPIRYAVAHLTFAAPIEQARLAHTASASASKIGTPWIHTRYKAAMIFSG